MSVTFRRHRAFVRASTVLATGLFLGACSTDAMRFQDVVTTATTMTPNQQAIIKQRGPVNQAFPGDEANESSENLSNPAPVGTVTGGSLPAVERKPLAAASKQGSNLSALAASAPETKLPPKRGALPLPSVNGGKKKLRVVGEDPVTTSSVTKDKPVAQKLTLPKRRAKQVAAVSGQSVDTRTTGSIPRSAAVPKTPNRKAIVKKPAMVMEAPVKTSSIKQRSSEPVKAPEQTGAGTFRWPARGRIITAFGRTNSGGRNDGIDISVPIGTPVKASENGTVIYAGSELEEFGNLVLVSHTGGWVSAYAHASETFVKRGDKVRRGQVIAKSGKTGSADVPKLHFELRKDSKPVNPVDHLAKG